MPTVLFLQFRSDLRVRDHEQACVEKLLEGKCNLKWCNIIADELTDPGDFDALILGGSALCLSREHKETTKQMRERQHTLKRTIPIIKQTIDRQIPIFGICFGHQLLSSVLEQEVIVDEYGGKRGTHHIMLTEEGKQDPIFQGLPDSFYVQYFHSEVVHELPEGAVLLAHGTRCPVSAFRYGDNVYGTQFHPEVDVDIMTERAHIRGEEEILPLIKPAPRAKEILFNFIDTIVLQ